MTILTTLGLCGFAWLFASVAHAQTPQRITHPLNDSRTLKRFLAERVVVDGNVTPREWLGCCEAIPICSGKTAWGRAACHQFSRQLVGPALLKRVGANVSVVDYHGAHDKRRHPALPSPLLTSNQMDRDDAGRRHSFLYAQSLSLDIINDRQKLAAWSKTRHLIGIRLIRLVRSGSVSSESSTSAVSERGIQFLLDRHFLLDVGRLDKPTRLAVIDVATARKKPVLLSRGFRSSSHACGQSDANQQTSAEELCAIAKGNGLVLIGPNRPLIDDDRHACTTLKAVDEYLIEQVKAFAALKCDAQSGSTQVMRHLGLSSNLPLLPDPADATKPARELHSRWHRFSARYIKSTGQTNELTQLLTDNWGRVLQASLPGVQPAHLLFPLHDKALSSDKAVQFQWEKPIVNNPKHMPGAVFGMRRHLIEIERLQAGNFAPHLKRKVVMGNKKVLQISEGFFRWRIVSSNRSGRSTSIWGHFSVVEPSSAL